MKGNQVCQETIELKTVTPFLMFHGNCEEAVNLYTPVIKDS